MRRFYEKSHFSDGRSDCLNTVKTYSDDRRSLATIVERLPSGLNDYIGSLLYQYPVEVRFVPRRSTKLGDHRPPSDSFPWHRITLNEDLNPYAVAVTLLHEVAHLITHLEYGSRRRLLPHGREWQQHYVEILRPVLAGSLLPGDLADAIRAAGDRPRAATCSDRRLLLALARYDAIPDRRVRIEELPPGSVFETETGRQFILGKRLRSRYRCLDAISGVEYRVHGLARVAPVEPD